MNRILNTRQLALLIACSIATQSASAVDVEAFGTIPTATGARPNVLFLIDTGDTMGLPTQVRQYDNGTTYAPDATTGCNAGDYYWSTSYQVPTSCSSSGINRIAGSAFRCAAIANLTGTASEPYPYPKQAGFSVLGSNGQFTKLTSTNSSGATAVYCKGEPGAPSQNNRFSSDVYVWKGNFINFLNSSQGASQVKDRLQVVKDAILLVARKYPNVNIGLMRTSTNGNPNTNGAASGGMVIQAFPANSSSDPTVIEQNYAALEAALTAQVVCKDGTGVAAACPVPTPPSLPLSYKECRRYLLPFGKDANNNLLLSPDPNYLENTCATLMYPNGPKPITEAYWEAANYFRGMMVEYGQNTNVDPAIQFPSVPGSITPETRASGKGNWRYLSPIREKCASNFIILLSDGRGEQDVGANRPIQTALNTLPTTDLEEWTDSKIRNPSNPNLECTNPHGWTTSGQNKDPSACADDLAFYLNKADLNTDPRFPGNQSVITYTVGFELNSISDPTSKKTATDFLKDIGAAGGGGFFQANGAAQLALNFEDIFERISATSTSFSSPSVTVNAFNRTQNLNELYMAVFAPEKEAKWEGNLKKYTLTPDGVIVDADGLPAVNDATGNFFETSRSLWAEEGSDDGKFAFEGGAAANLKLPVNRSIYVNENGGNALAALNTTVSAWNATTRRTKFALDAALTDADVTTRSNNLVSWIYGNDVFSENPDSDYRYRLGDPLHSKPAIVIYGGSAASPIARAFMTTNEGLLHSIRTSDGQEQWAFMPEELLSRLDFLATSVETVDTVLLRDRTDPKYYGLDGSPRVLRIDRDGDGTIESGDKVFLFFGMRRGGTKYYAMDVTNPDSPILLWTYALPDGAQSWSQPTLAQISIEGSSAGTWANYGSTTGFDNGGARNAFNHWVIVVGGGYDPGNDTTGYATDSRGNRVIMLGAISGAVVWSAGKTGATGPTPDLQLSRMQHSIPSDVRVVDFTSDGLADAMYVGDLGGQVWRFDIRNGKNRSALVEGGVFASLGGAESASSRDDRRFFYAPDIARIDVNGQLVVNVAIGSGHREHPVEENKDATFEVDNYFYSLRDLSAGYPMPSTAYQATVCSTTPCLQWYRHSDTRVQDITATPELTTLNSGVTGWKLEMQNFGEKVLAESRTFENRIYVTSYSPEVIESDSAVCDDTVGVNRLYVIGAATGNAIYNNDGRTEVTPLDRSKILDQGSIAPEVVFVFPSPPANCTGSECAAPEPICLVGLESCGRNLGNTPVRTYWRQGGTP